MKILQISNKSPYPPSEGGPIAMNAIICGLQNTGNEVHVLTMSTPKYPVVTENIPESFRNKTRFKAITVDNKLRYTDAFRNLFTGKSYNIERFITPDFREALMECLKNHRYDVIILESLYVTPYIQTIRQYSDAKIILRAHNIEHLIWQRLSEATKNPLKKYYLKLLAKRLFRYEKQILLQVDAVAAITDKDAVFFQKLAPTARVGVVPFGIETSRYIYTPQNVRHISLCHVGSMDWLPNIEGIAWFLEKCWNGIHAVFPEIKLYLAGRNMPAWLKKSKYPNVNIVGEVEDAQVFLSNHPVTIVPLRSGSGVRVKIVEAMALGRTVISTTVGAEGIQYTHGKNILIADTPLEFFERIKDCIRNPELCETIGNNARQLVESQHNIETAARAMLQLIEEL